MYTPTPPDGSSVGEFATMTYSGSGEVTGALQNVDLVLPPGPTPSSSDSGCEAADFAGFTPGNIALLQRGTCDFVVKAQNAAAAGAIAAVIFNEGQPGRTATLLGNLGQPVSIPVVGTGFDIGQELAGLAGAAVHIKTDTTSEIRTTWNVLADSRWGDPNKVVMSGAHLDSVPDPEQAAFRLVERRGAGAARLAVLRRQPAGGRAGEDQAVPGLRHGRLAELRLQDLRR